MKKNLFLVATLLATSVGANAQFNLGTASSNASKLTAGFTTDSTDVGVPWWEWDGSASNWKWGNLTPSLRSPVITLNYHYNSDRADTGTTGGGNSGTAADTLSPVIIATTNNAAVRPFLVRAYDGERIITSGVLGSDKNNPVLFASDNALVSYLSEPTRFIPGGGIVPGTLGYKDSLVVAQLSVDGTGGAGSNRALAVYPGKWKKTDVRLGFNFANDSAKSDIAFTLIPISKGSAGYTESTKYKVVVSMIPNPVPAGAPAHNNGDFVDSPEYGSSGELTNGVRRWEFDNVITASSTSGAGDSVRFSLFEKAGLSVDDLSYKRIMVAIIGSTTGADPSSASGTYAPFVGIDNVTCAAQLNLGNKISTSLGQNAVKKWVSDTTSVLYVQIGTVMSDTINIDMAVKADTLVNYPAEPYNTRRVRVAPKFPTNDGGRHQSFINDALTWKSLDEDVATVDEDSRVTCLQNGFARIVATTVEGSFTDTVVMRVTGGAETLKYTVKFEVNGGTAVADIEVNAGEKVTKPTDPTKEGNVFGGWYKEAAFTTTWNFETDVVTAATTLYAKWDSGSGISDVTVATKVIGSQGRIEIVGAEATVTVYSIIGQKVATVVAGDQVVPVPAGVYLVAEKNKPIVKVIVK